MRLFLIRHGQSTNNAILDFDEYEHGRTHDPELTETGRKQTAHVAEFLAKAIDMPSPEPEPIEFTHLYVSPMKRALDTAKPIAEALHLKPQVWVDIHEIGGLFTADEDDVVTAYHGMTRAEMSDCYPNYILPDGIREEGWWGADKGREEPSQFIGRAIGVAMALRERAHTEDKIALVAHAAFFDLLMKAFLNQLPNHPLNLFFNHYNTGISRLDFDESRWARVDNHIRVHYFNRVTHLPPELWTW